MRTAQPEGMRVVPVEGAYTSRTRNWTSANGNDIFVSFMIVMLKERLMFPRRSVARGKRNDF